MSAEHSAIPLLDPDAWADLRTYLERARRLDPAGAVRLVADGRVLAAYVAARRGRDLTGTGTVLALRVATLAAATTIDITVPIAGVLDRLARSTEDLDLSVPPVAVAAPWAGLSPPRSGWAPSVERVLGADLEGIATALGFIDGTQPRVFEVGRWSRFSWPRGHLLVR